MSCKVLVNSQNKFAINKRRLVTQSNHLRTVYLNYVDILKKGAQEFT